MDKIKSAYLIIANKEEKRAAEFIIANKELDFQKREKEKCIAKLIIAEQKLVYQNKEKQKQAAALSIANNELKEAQEQFRLVVESSAFAMVLVNNEGFITLVNNQTEKLFGYERKELIGNKPEILLPERFRKHHTGLRNTFFKTPETCPMGAGRDLFGMKKNGTEVQVEIGLNSIETAQGNLVLASIIDITERKIQEANLKQQNKELAFQNDEKEKRAAELVVLSGDLKAQKEELRRANDDLEKRVFKRTYELENLNHELKDLSVSKDKFLSVISHDLRNPLTALLLASDQLNSPSKNNTFDRIQPFIKIIHRASHNILQQLNELVDWAKMQQKKTTLNPERIHLASAVDQSFELLQYNAAQKNITFENKVPLDIYVKADALMLRSILQNLVTNSIKYGLQGGLVMVTAHRIDKLAEICIIDSGIRME